MIDLGAAIAEGEAIGTDSFAEIETFVGGAAADTFIATEAPAVGEAPVDNTFIGGAGEDTLSYEDATQSVTIDLGAATAEGAEIGTDSFAEIETFVGGTADDTFLATETPAAEVAPVDNTFIGGAGEDTLSYEDATQSVTIDIGAGTATGEQIGTDSFAEIETFVGGAADDTFIATEQPAAGEVPVDNTFVGSAGEDTLSYEGTQAELLIDTIRGIASGDTIGTDNFASFEHIVGGTNDDTIIVGVGIVSIDGGSGSDTFIFMADDTAFEATGNGGSGSGTEIRNFEVGDVVRLDRFDIFERALDAVQDAFDNFIDNFEQVNGDVLADDIPIRIRSELVEDMWKTFIDADFDHDSIYEFSITIDGQHDLIVTHTSSNSGSGHA
jgi:uncharacterized protein YqfA (UPF0365 family)